MTVSSSVGPAIVRSDEGLVVGVRVSPSAPSTAFRGLYGDRMKVALAAPPEDGRANAELVRALAAWLEVPKESVKLHSGHASRDKTVIIGGMEERDLRSRLHGLATRHGGVADRHQKGGRRGS